MEIETICNRKKNQIDPEVVGKPKKTRFWSFNFNIKFLFKLQTIFVE